MNSVLSFISNNEKKCEWSDECTWTDDNTNVPAKSKAKTVCRITSVIAYHKNIMSISQNVMESSTYSTIIKEGKSDFFESMIECMTTSPFIPYVIMYETYEETPRELSVISEYLHESMDESTLLGRHHLEEEKKLLLILVISPKSFMIISLGKSQMKMGHRWAEVGIVECR
jgi:hypothetical protein